MNTCLRRLMIIIPLFRGEKRINAARSHQREHTNTCARCIYIHTPSRWCTCKLVSMQACKNYLCAFESDPAKTRRKSFSAAREIIIIIRRRKEITYNNSRVSCCSLWLHYSPANEKPLRCSRTIQFCLMEWRRGGATRSRKNKSARCMKSNGLIYMATRLV